MASTLMGSGSAPQLPGEPLSGGLDAAAPGVHREIWPQKNVAIPRVEVEMNLLCFAGDLSGCRVGYRATGLMEK